MAPVVRTLSSPIEARALPAGTIVGDLHGGLTFSDEIAAVLEARSHRGWYEFRSGPGEYWTIIFLDR